MSFLIRIIDYTKWMWEEMQGKKSTEGIYNELAKKGKYDTVVEYNIRVQAIRKVLRYITHPYNKVLDLACGTGAVISALPDNKHMSVIGIDISQEMLAIAKKRFASYSHIQLRQASFLDVTFPHTSFDLIVIAHAIRFVPTGKEQQFIRNVSKWLKKDGTFLIIQTNPLKIPIISSFTNRFIKGSNYLFQDEKNILQIMNSHFRLDKKITIGRQAILFTTKAYYFRKL